MPPATSSPMRHHVPRLSAPVQKAMRNLAAETQEPLKRVVTIRILDALRTALRSAQRQDLEAAAAASTNIEAVLATFGTQEVMARAGVTHPHLFQAQARGLEMRERLLRAEGGTLTVMQVAKHFHISRQSVDRRRRQGQLLAIPIGRHGYRYPAWQLTPGGTLPGWAEVLAVLQNRDGWSKMIFFLSPNDRLQHRTPLAALRQGQVNDVVAAAAAYGEHGAA